MWKTSNYSDGERARGTLEINSISKDASVSSSGSPERRSCGQVGEGSL